MVSDEDKKFLSRSLELAKEAAQAQEVPVGALVVCEGQVVAEAFNQKEADQISLHHAEILALQRASEKLGRWRLEDCTLYISLEPCVMCAGAVLASRLQRVVFAAADPKGGALGSLYNLHEDERLNHRFEVIFENADLAEESGQLLKSFFSKRRK